MFLIALFYKGRSSKLYIVNLIWIVPNNIYQILINILNNVKLRCDSVDMHLMFDAVPSNIITYGIELLEIQKYFIAKCTNEHCDIKLIN